MGPVSYTHLDRKVTDEIEAMIQELGEDYGIQERDIVTNSDMLIACLLYTSKGLNQRLEGAVDLAVMMMESFDESLRSGLRLNERFDRTFE